MPIFKLLFVAMRLRRGWKRIPPAQRRRMVEGAARAVRKRGPTVAKRVGTAVREARRGR